MAPDGTSLIAAGLDHWYEPENPGSTQVDLEEFKIREWRLERELDVDSLRVPPDFRGRPPHHQSAQEFVNVGLTIPFLRFPQWHVCHRCQRLEPFPLVMRETPRCAACAVKLSGQRNARPPAMVQVRFIALCDRGHIQDFPWREWVHEDPNPGCLEPLRLIVGGAASLTAVRVVCECGKSRSLEGITEAAAPEPVAEEDGNEGIEPSTYLTRNLAPGHEFVCPGKRPWLGEEEGQGCGRPLRGSLRGATNVHFSHVRTAIYLPRGNAVVPSELVDIVESTPLRAIVSLLKDLGQPVEPGILRKYHGAVLAPFSDDEIAAALDLANAGGAQDDEAGVEGDDSETAFRRAEFAAVRSARREDQLLTTPMELGSYSADVARYFGVISLVPKLRETRAFVGFARVFPENSQTLAERRALLWRSPPHRPDRWLSACVVHGEGAYLELVETLLRTWESEASVVARVGPLAHRYGSVQQRRKLRERSVSPRFVLLHTVAHLLMNQLTFECGYSTASLRERLYVSTNPSAPMAGILIYTAAGDAEGTMGGLVRMAKPGNLEPVIRRAIQGARWCSSDPVCMELGASGGQGPDSCNLAACHNCALVPETSCEEFNRFLDRGLVVGTVEKPSLGFFADLT